MKDNESYLVFYEEGNYSQGKDIIEKWIGRKLSYNPLNYNGFNLLDQRFPPLILLFYDEKSKRVWKQVTLNNRSVINKLVNKYKSKKIYYKEFLDLTTIWRDYIVKSKAWQELKVECPFCEEKLNVVNKDITGFSCHECCGYFEIDYSGVK